MNWISVEEKLPEVNTPVLCYSDALYRYPIECHYDVCIFKGEYTHSAWDENKQSFELQEGYRWPLFERVDTGTCRNYTHWAIIEPPVEEK